jgi:hypothetical protein
VFLVQHTTPPLLSVDVVVALGDVPYIDLRNGCSWTITGVPGTHDTSAPSTQSSTVLSHSPTPQVCCRVEVLVDGTIAVVIKFIADLVDGTITVVIKSIAHTTPLLRRSVDAVADGPFASHSPTPQVVLLRSSSTAPSQSLSSPPQTSVQGRPANKDDDEVRRRSNMTQQNRKAKVFLYCVKNR